MATQGVELEYAQTMAELTKIGEHLHHNGSQAIAQSLYVQVQRIREHMNAMHGITTGTVHVNSHVFKEQFTDQLEWARSIHNEEALDVALATAEKNYTKSCKTLERLMGVSEKSVMYFYARACALTAIVAEKKEARLRLNENKKLLRDIDRQQRELKEKRRQIKNGVSTTTTTTSIPLVSRPLHVLHHEDEEDDLDDVRLLEQDMADLEAPGNDYESDSD